MSTNAIISLRTLDINNLTFQVGQAKNGRNPPINMKYNGQNLQIRLPRMRFPGGVLIRDGQKPDDNKSYTLIGSLTGADPYGKERSTGTDDMSKLYNFMLDLEDKIIASAVENSTKWFGKKRSEEAIRDGFKTLMRMSVDKVDGEYIPNGKYPPSMTIKVPVYDNKVSVDFVDNRGQPMYASPTSLSTILPKGVEANLAVSGSIYVIAGGGFGVTWRLTYAQVFPQSRVTAAQVFADEIEEGDEEEEVTQPASTPVEPTPTSPPVDLEVPELDAAPAPAPARKRRVAAGQV